MVIRKEGLNTLSSDIFKSTKKQKEEAKIRLKRSEQERGSDEVYYNELMKTYEKFSDTREQANKKGV